MFEYWMEILVVVGAVVWTLWIDHCEDRQRRRRWRRHGR
jgi:hypothetical protein